MVAVQKFWIGESPPNLPKTGIFFPSIRYILHCSSIHANQLDVFFFIVQIKRKPNRTIFEKSSPHGPHGVCRTRRNKFDEEKKIGYYELNYFKCYIFLCYVRSLNVCRAQRVLMRKDNETRTAIIKKKRTNNLFMVSVRFIYKWLCDRMCDSQRKIICILFQLNGTREKLYKTN